MTDQEVLIGLLRGLQRQFGDLSELASAKGLQEPDTSFVHYRKLGEAAGLHTAWRTVADLADQVAEGKLPVRADAGTSADDNPGQHKGVIPIDTPTVSESLRVLQADLAKQGERAQARRSKAPEGEKLRHEGAAEAYHEAWRRVAELAQRVEDRERLGL